MFDAPSFFKSNKFLVKAINYSLILEKQDFVVNKSAVDKRSPEFLLFPF